MIKRRLLATILGIGFGALIGVSLLSNAAINSYVEQIKPQNREDVAQSKDVLGFGSPDASASKYFYKWKTEQKLYFGAKVSQPNNGIYSWDEISDEQIDEFLPYFESFNDEISKYGHGALSKYGLKQVFFVDNIKLMQSGQKILGFADVLSGAIYFNVENARANTTLIESTVHHEIGHIIFYDKFGSNMYDLAGWPRVDESNVVADENTGYVNSYSKSSISEDMAEVYAYIMTDNLKEVIYSRSAYDKVLLEKLNFVEKIVR